MKKLFNLILFAACASVLVSCGPSEEERKKQEEETIRFADSLKNAVKSDIAAGMDSLKREDTKDSLVKVDTKTETKTNK